MPSRPQRRPPASAQAAPAAAEPQRVEVVSLSTDPIASLGAFDITISCGGEHVIPAHNADVWLAVLLEAEIDPYRIFPTLGGFAVVDAVEDAIMAGQITLADVGDAALDLITLAAGRPWWACVRLLGTVRHVFDRVHGKMILAGVRANEVSLAAWLDACYSVTLDMIEPSKITKFSTEIMAAPPGYEVELDFDNEEKAFAAAMQAMT
jgi:hypothetical protein